MSIYSGCRPQRQRAVTNLKISREMVSSCHFTRVRVSFSSCSSCSPLQLLSFLSQSHAETRVISFSKCSSSSATAATSVSTSFNPCQEGFGNAAYVAGSMGLMPSSRHETAVLQLLHAAFLAVIVIHEPLSNCSLRKTHGRYLDTGHNLAKHRDNMGQLELRQRHGGCRDNVAMCDHCVTLVFCVVEWGGPTNLCQSTYLAHKTGMMSTSVCPKRSKTTRLQ